MRLVIVADVQRLMNGNSLEPKLQEGANPPKSLKFLIHSRNTFTAQIIPLKLIPVVKSDSFFNENLIPIFLFLFPLKGIEWAPQ